MNQSSGIARSLRQKQTTAEKLLWRQLRDRQINGRKWRRQQQIDQYVVDFCCPELRLILEIDGDVHVFQEKRDAKRQAYLQAQGFNILRFNNNDVIKNMDGVLTVIWEASGEGNTPHPSPLPQGERGET